MNVERQTPCIQIEHSHGHGTGNQDVVCTATRQNFNRLQRRGENTYSEVSTVQYVLVLGLIVTARSVPHILLAWAISSLHWLVLTVFPLSTAHKVGHGSFGRIMRRIIYYSVLLQFTPNSVLTSGSVLLPNLSTRMQVFLGSTRHRSWTLWRTFTKSKQCILQASIYNI